MGVSRKCAGPAAPLRRGFSVGRGLVSLLRTRFCKIAVKNIVALDGCVLEEFGRLVHCFDGPFEAASTAELLCPVGSGVRMRVHEPVANVYSTTKVFLKPHQAVAKSVVEGRCPRWPSQARYICAGAARVSGRFQSRRRLASLSSRPLPIPGTRSCTRRVPAPGGRSRLRGFVADKPSVEPNPLSSFVLALLAALYNRGMDREKQLETFVKHVEALRRLPLVTKGQGVGWSLNFNQLKGMSVSVNLLDEKDLRSFLVTFRMFIAAS